MDFGCCQLVAVLGASKWRGRERKRGKGGGAELLSDTQRRMWSKRDRVKEGQWDCEKVQTCKPESDGSSFRLEEDHENVDQQQKGIPQQVNHQVINHHPSL